MVSVLITRAVVGVSALDTTRKANCPCLSRLARRNTGEKPPGNANSPCVGAAGVGFTGAATGAVVVAAAGPGFATGVGAGAGAGAGEGAGSGGGGAVSPDRIGGSDTRAWLMSRINVPGLNKTANDS